MLSIGALAGAGVPMRPNAVVADAPASSRRRDKDVSAMTSTSLYCDYVRADDRPPVPSVKRFAFAWNRKPLANVASDAVLVRVRARRMAEDHSKIAGAPLAAGRPGA